MGFPNFRNKHAKNEMFSPREFLGHSQEMGLGPKGKPCKAVILYYSKDSPANYLPGYTLVKKDFFAADFYLLKETGNKVGVMNHFGVGAPAAVIALEELVAWGVKDFITIGTAGTLQDNVNIGDLAVCDRAIRDEGTSHHYLASSKYAFASRHLAEKIKKALESFGAEYFVGTSWTTDAIYRETKEEVKKYQQEKVLTVEMEAAALFSVAKFRKVNVAALFTISDLLAELEWKPDFYHDKLDESKRLLFKAAVKALCEKQLTASTKKLKK
jgi:uridine phosphorylase